MWKGKSRHNRNLCGGVKYRKYRNRENHSLGGTGSIDITKSKDTQDDKKNFPDELPVFTDALWQTFPILESARDSIAELLNQEAISLETGRIDNTYAVADLLLKRKNPDAKEEIASITLHTNVHAEKVFSADTSRIITESGKVFQIPNDFMVYSAGSTVEDFTVSPIANLVRAKESYLIEKKRGVRQG